VPERKQIDMDEDFADVMYALGTVEGDLVKRRWAVVARHAANLTTEKVPRLVQIAHEVPGDREADRWFWGPFKDDDETFLVADAHRLHAVLAGYCLRVRIRSGRHPIDAHLTRLAGLHGLKTPLEGLQELAHRTLMRSGITPPGPWTAMTVSDGGDPAQSVDVRLQALMESATSAVTALAAQIDALSAWAQDAERRFDREYEVIQWLLAGRRSDGKQWEDLDPGAVVIDAANELAEILAGPPQPQHENILGQILRLANVPASGSLDLSLALTSEVIVANRDLAGLLPLTSSHGSTDTDSYSVSLRAL
jgi:hypothetical protein